MAGALTTIRIYHDTNEPAAKWADRFNIASGNTQKAANALARFFEAAAGGSEPCKIVLTVESSTTAVPVPATLDVTITHANVTDGDTLVIGPVTMTYKTSAANESQVTIATTDTTDAAAMVTKINAHSVLSGLVVASNASGVITLTAIDPGNAGRLLVSTNDATAVDVGGGVLAYASGASTVSLAPVTWGRGRQ